MRDRYINIKRPRRAANLFSISNSTLCDDEQQPQQAAINDWGLKSPSRNYRLFSSRAPPGANFALKWLIIGVHVNERGRCCCWFIFCVPAALATSNDACLMSLSLSIFPRPPNFWETLACKHSKARRNLFLIFLIVPGGCAHGIVWNFILTCFIWEALCSNRMRSAANW